MILIDTNIFTRIAEKTNDPLRAMAKSALAQLQKNQETLVVAPQCLYEFWVVMTRPIQNNGCGFTSTKATWWLGSIRNMATLLTDDLDVYYNWEALVSNKNVLGKQGHDAHLVAWMQRHNVTKILTFNTGDFARYGITVVDLRKL